MHVRIYTHNFQVSGYNRYGYEFLKQFGVSNFGETDFRAIRINKFRSKFGKNKEPLPTVKRTYARSTKNGREFRFHIHCLDLFKAAVSNDPVLCNQVTYEIEPRYEPLAVDLNVLPKYSPKDQDQINSINYLNSPGDSKVLCLRTGGGKTYCSLQSAADYKQRVVVSIESRFFNLWREALLPGPKQVLDLKEEEVLFVQGSKELCEVMTNSLEGKIDHVKVIVLAARTLANYFETYEKYGEDCLLYYPVKPIDLYQCLQGGTRIKDELHLSYYANFVEELYLHGPRSFSLSATLKNGTFRDSMMDLMFPPNIRPPETTLVKYIDVQALMYSLVEPTKVKFTNPGSTDYNHNAYENWILKDKSRTERYVQIVLDWVKVRYLNDNYEKGQKAAIFATSVKMATVFTFALKKAYGNKVSTARYAASAGDVYSMAAEADILVTTVQSFGTGFDLEGLICCLMTTSINSSDTNIQVLGRLRELKMWMHLTPIFDYLVCIDIQKHVSYHEDKKKQFASRVKSHTYAYLKNRV